MSDERDLSFAFSHSLCRMKCDTPVHSGERALGRLALRTPVIVGYTSFDLVGYQSPGE